MRPIDRYLRLMSLALFAVVASGKVVAEAAVTWPTRGTIEFRVYYGDDGLRLGKTTHTWRHDAKSYSMRSLVETSGLAALVKDFRLEQESEGAVTAAGLKPSRFTADQKGKPFQSARFDWGAQRVFIDRGDSKREAAIQPGDQDVLSIMHQLPRLKLDGIDQKITLINNKAASQSVIEDKGIETLDLPMGQVRTRHLAVRSLNKEVSLDLWLALDKHLLPVRVRMTDRKGEILDQQAERVILGDNAS